ncbi:hypothetical protein HPG69_011531, partial [Diceros bicornis minor]
LPSVLAWGGCSLPTGGRTAFWSRQTSEPLLSCSAGLGPGRHLTSAPPLAAPLALPPASGLAPLPWTQYTQPRASAQRETKGTAWVPTAMASTFILGLNPHYMPGYTGHCPLLRSSMGQTYGQANGQLLRGSPGLA